MQQQFSPGAASKRFREWEGCLAEWAKQEQHLKWEQKPWMLPSQFESGSCRHLKSRLRKATQLASCAAEVLVAAPPRDMTSPGVRFFVSKTGQAVEEMSFRSVQGFTRECERISLLKRARASSRAERLGF